MNMLPDLLGWPKLFFMAKLKVHEGEGDQKNSEWNERTQVLAKNCQKWKELSKCVSNVVFSHVGI